MLYELKAAMLTIEAALPLGCILDRPDETKKTVKLKRDEVPLWLTRVENATTANEVCSSFAVDGLIEQS